MSNCCNKKPRIRSLRKQTEFNIPSAITQVAIRYGGKSDRVAVCQIEVVLLKIRGSHLTCKVSNKCLNDRESTKTVEKEQKWPIPSSASSPLPLSFSVFAKETTIEKKRQPTIFIVNSEQSQHSTQCFNLAIFIFQRRTHRSETIFGNCKSFKNDKKCFSFHHKSSFNAQDT